MLTSRAGLVLFASVGYGYWSMKPDSHREAPLIESDIPLVLIPGLKGSVLTNQKTNMAHYVTPKQSLRSSWNLSLELPLSWNNGTQEYDDLEVLYSTYFFFSF